MGATPESVVQGDFNQDGKPDLAIANQSDNTVTVLLGNGTGAFTAAPGSPFTVGQQPQSVVTADFNGDGKPDLAIANASDGTLTVLLGDGTGGFTAATGSPFAAGSSPHSVAVGDFNGDGKADLAIADTNGNNLTVLLGNGTGGFAAATGSPFPAGSFPASVAVGDFNGDGKADLAIANGGPAGNTVTVLLGDGTGAFTAATGSPFTVGASPASVAVGDFNGDGKPDLAVANSLTNNVTVLLGNGTGGFTAAAGSPFPVGAGPISVAIADFNQDGKADLAIANGTGNTVTVLQGNGAGSFTAAAGSPFAAGSGPVSVAVADFNGDAKADLAIANSGSNNVTVLLNSSPASNLNWEFTPAAASPFAVGAYPISVASADFDGNGKADLVVANEFANTVTVLLGNGTGGFTAASGSPSVGASPVAVAVGDFNRDGKPDIAVANQFDNTVTVLLGDGTGGFAAAAGSPFAVGAFPVSLAVGDFNVDGKLDIAVVNASGNSVTMLLGNGTGGFTEAAGSPFTAAPFPIFAAVGDFNGDDKPDLAITSANGNTVTVLLGNGLGGFTAATGSPFAVGSVPNGIAVGDFNRDGKLDLAIANQDDNTVTVLLGNGTGSFTAAAGSPFAVGPQPISVSVGDFNQDGKPDLTVSNISNGTATVLLGDGTGGFTAATGSPFAIGAKPYSVVVADFNGDGKPDLAGVNSSANTVTVLLNTVTPPMFTISPPPGTTLSSTLANFSWNTVSGATEYQLTVGTTPGASNVFSGTTTATSQTVNFMPCNGGTLFVQLSAEVGGSFQPAADYSYPCKSAIGDFNADHFQDLVWQNNSTAQVNVNYYGGAGPQAHGSAIMDDGGDLAGWVLVASADFDGNGVADLVYQNTQTHQVNVNYYGGAGGTTIIGAVCLSCGINTTDWQLVAVADFDHNGTPDLVYQNTQNHQVNVDYYGGASGSTFMGWACLSCGINTDVWQVRAAADFDGNGTPDLVYQNIQTNQVNVDYYGGTGGATFTGWACLSCGINTTGWQVAGASDMNADGVPDLIYRNTQTGQVNVDYYGGAGGASFKGWNCLNCGAIVNSVALRAVAKFSNTGEPELIYQNTVTNAVAAYYYVLPGAVFQGWACLSCGINTTDWQVVGTGDFDGNGVPDLVYQNTQTGQVNVDYYGGTGGASFIGWNCLNCAVNTAGWKVKAIADFNGDGVPDLVYQNQTTNEVDVSYYGGTGGATFISSACLSCGINTANWQVKAAADFDGNGTPDLVYQNTQTNQVNVDYYEGPGGSTFKGWACLSCSISVTGWTLIGASDFDGNGVPDLVYLNLALGQLHVNYYGGPGGATFTGWNALNYYAGWTPIVPKSR